MNIETDSAYIAELRARCERAEQERDAALDALKTLRDAHVATTARLSGYNWNADPDNITRQQGDAWALAAAVLEVNDGD